MGKRQFMSGPHTKSEREQEIESNGHKKTDIESGANGHHTPRRPVTPKKPRRYPRFRDVVDHAMNEVRRDELKQKLRTGIASIDFAQYYKSKDSLKQIENKKLRKFYEKQNNIVDMWIEVDTLVYAMSDDLLDSMDPDHDDDGIAERAGALQDVAGHISELLPPDTREERAKANKKATWAIYINVIANILLLAAKGIAALRSSSLSLIASLVDSALDLLCTLIVWTTNRLVQWRVDSLSERFPVGRRRLEPLGILVFSVIMVISFLQVLNESIGKLRGEHTTSNLPPEAIGALAGTVGLKGLIWIGCARIKSTQVQVRPPNIPHSLQLTCPGIGARLQDRCHLQHAFLALPTDRISCKCLVARSR